MAFDRLDRGAIQTNDQAALELLGQGIETVSARGDKLVKAAGGVRAAAAALRQALLLEEGSLPVSGKGLDALEGLVGKDELEALRGLAAFGAPTLQAAEPPTTVFKKPYPTAAAAAGDLGFTSLKDAARGRAFWSRGLREETWQRRGRPSVPSALCPKRTRQEFSQERCARSRTYAG